MGKAGPERELHVTDLAAGDRVVLACPHGRHNATIEAVFDGLTDRPFEMPPGECAIVVQPADPTYMASGRVWARFLSRTDEYGGKVVMLLRVDADGGMTEDEGRRVYVAERVTMGRG